MTLVPGTRLGPYELVAPLGAGGMGEVWRARDPRLGREVAIKVLPAEVAGDPERVARFEREARSLAALSHPNIVAVHDVGREGEVAYLVTELLEGETLRERLGRERLPWRGAAEIAAALADGLAAAHGRGIVHRDLKPENVFLTADGRVKILDFGLARQVLPPLDEERTRTSPPPGTLAGAVLGTVGYMSPEQVRGQAADARSDLFALGCVLFEMLVGERAFRRETAAETMAAIVREPAPEVPGSGAAVPPELGRIVAHCLEKRPEERFQSARDLAFDLGAIATDTGGARTAPALPGPARRRRVPWLAAGGIGLLAIAAGLILLVLRGAEAPPSRQARSGGRVRIVVLPFENLGAAEDGYFAAGVAEEITSRLANVEGLAVISRTSAVGYDRRGKTLKEIGADLGQGFLLGRPAGD